MFKWICGHSLAYGETPYAVQITKMAAKGFVARPLAVSAAYVSIGDRDDFEEKSGHSSDHAIDG
jgi:hypothetical protein